jgi:HAD superfamily 5'-nucleotidase-like hydrolase
MAVDSRGASGLAQLLSLSREVDIPRKKRIFVNRSLKLEDVELIGFDMDYTLAIYRQAEMEKLSIQLTLKKLVENRGYSPSLLELDYPAEYAIRGLMVDKQLGNVFKMDRHAHVGRCTHGTRVLNRAERTALYRQARVKTSAPRYAWIDTLFALPEAVMYLRLIDFYERDEKGARQLDYGKLWEDIRACIDEAHRDDSLKSIVRADLGRFLWADPELPAALHKLRSAGKKMFLLTNSLWDYTDALMRYLLDEKLPAYPSWRHYFDVIIVAGQKPAFFTDTHPFVEIEPLSGKIIGPVKGALLRGHVYQGGHLADFEEKVGSRGDRVLYVGDHIYGDILRAKKSSVWRTCMIVQELEEELAAMARLGNKLTLLDELDRKRRNLDAEVDFQNLVLKSLQRMADNGEGELPSGSPFASLDEAKRATKEALDRLRTALRDTTNELDRLEDEVERGFNPLWGPIFKEGHENSRFGEQVEDYACLYTSRVSNFLAYSPLRYFRAPRDIMPHEM